MKKLMYMVALAAISLAGHSQAIVNDPVVAANTTAIEAHEFESMLESFKQTEIYRKLLEHQQDIRDAMEKYDVINKLETVKKLNRLIENVACATDDFEFYLGFTDKYENCITKVELDKVLIKFEMSSDMLYLIFGGAKLITSGDRIKTLEDAILLLEEAYNEMMNISAKIRHKITFDIVEKYMENTKVNEYAISRY